MQVLLCFLLCLAAAAANRPDHEVERSTAVATDCSVARNGDSRCKLVFDRRVTSATKSLQLTVRNQGRIVTCTRGMRNGNDENKWSGHCDGDAWDAVFVTVKDESGKPNLFGSIKVDKDACSISPNVINGESEIVCSLASKYMPVDYADELPMKKEIHEDAHSRALISGFTPSTSASSSLSTAIRGTTPRALNQRNISYDDSGSTVDIMVVWTKAAECDVSGLDLACRTLNATTEFNMRGAIARAVGETNTAFTDSGVLTQLRLVHAYREETFVESTNWTLPFYEDLVSIQSTTDKKMDGVHAKRKLYRADMVHLIAAGPTCQGIAYLATRSEEMFSVSGSSCLGYSYVFAHEVGHNFGANHDRGTENKCNETGDSYNYAYRHPNATFITILSSRRLGLCDNITEFPWTMALRYSNPDKLYDGLPTGTARANNAKRLNERRTEIAKYYQAMNCFKNEDCTDDNAQTTDTCNADTGACVFTPKPTLAPTKVPTRAPIKVTKSPTKAPTAAPKAAPIQAPLLLTSPASALAPVDAPPAPTPTVVGQPVPTPAGVNPVATGAPIGTTVPAGAPIGIRSPITTPVAGTASPVNGAAAPTKSTGAPAMTAPVWDGATQPTPQPIAQVPIQRPSTLGNTPMALTKAPTSKKKRESFLKRLFKRLFRK